MPFRDADTSLRDIADAIGMIEQFTAGMDFEAFRQDPKTIAAVERKLQIISEAAIRIGTEAERRCPGIAWPDIRGIGNWLRHLAMIPILSAGEKTIHASKDGC